MRYLVIALLILSACGKNDEKSKPPCEGNPVVGTWSALNFSDTMVIDANCHGTTTYCSSDFDIVFDAGSNIKGTVSISKSNGAGGCYSVGKHTCYYGVSGSALSYDCGSGALAYVRL